MLPWGRRDSTCTMIRVCDVTENEAYATLQTQKNCITFIERRPNVFDVCPTLYKCYTNVLCLLGRTSAQRLRRWSNIV